MGDNSNQSSATSINPYGSGAATKLTGKTLAVTVAFFFIVVIFLLFIFFYAHRYQGVRSIARRRRWRRSSAQSHLILAAGIAPVPSLGLDPSVLSSLPVTIYRQSEVKEAIDCAVCLTELTDGEKTRLLPKCNHKFHLECIDMWFQSQSTCPLCRSPVVGGDVISLKETGDLNTERLDLEAERMLAVSIPVQSAEIFRPPLPPFPAEEMKSPVEGERAPVISKMGSLRRILSRGQRTGSSVHSTSPRVGDIEQGMVGAADEDGSSDLLKTTTSHAIL